MLNDLKQTPAGTLNIDWDLVEAKLGFQLHDNIKNYFSRISGTYCINGLMEYDPVEFSKESISKEAWLENASEGRSFADYALCLLNDIDSESVYNRLYDLFFGDWTGGNDFGHRAYVGEIIINIGQITIVFNNDTGKFEWADFGYGYFDVYEENPYGIIADTTEELLEKIHIDESILAELASLEEEDD